MDKTCSYDICTGCGGCSVVCPKDCISFISQEDGHIYPKINPKVCIDCKRCEMVCPALNYDNLKYPLSCYAALINDPYDYATTTSGGAAQALSRLVIDEGGCVYGCAAMPGVEVNHIKVEKTEDLEKLKGSKYVQSNAWLVYKDLIKEIKSGRKVLFIGTPCQCAAVNKLFKTRPNNLLLVDLICHGVPSLASLKSYFIKHGNTLNDIHNIKFRTQKGFQIVVENEFKQSIYKSEPLFSKIFEDSYFGAFYYGLSYRNSCYSCQFAKPERCSDITIGDFWGLGREIPANEIPNHEKGISVLLINTELGGNAVKKTARYMNLYARPTTEAIKGNSQLRNPSHKSKRVIIYKFLRKFLSQNTSYQVSSIDKTTKAIIKKYLLFR